MWKVIAADDEPFIREALKEMIPWDELGCHLAETLKNSSSFFCVFYFFVVFFRLKLIKELI